MDEYHVMGANGMRGVQNELKKRAAEGWRLHNEFSETLQRADPSDLLFMRLGSYSRRLSGRVAYASHEWDVAGRHFEVMLAIRKDMAMREPDVPHRHLELADAHTCIGRAARKLPVYLFRFSDLRAGSVGKAPSLLCLPP